MGDSKATTGAWPAASILEKQDGTFLVRWNDVGLSDATLEQFVESRLKTLLESLPRRCENSTAQSDDKNSSRLECVVDLSGNQLQKPGPLATLLRQLTKASMHVTALRLHKNELTDICAAPLAEHVQRAADAGLPLMQLHLSGNRLTAAGVKSLIQAAHRCRAYPRPSDAQPLRSLGSADAKRRALWLRCENQRPPIGEAAELIKQCCDEGFPVVIVGNFEAVPSHAVVQMHCAFTSAGFGDTGKGKNLGNASGKGQNYDPVRNAGGKGPKGVAAGKFEGKASGKVPNNEGCGKSSKGAGGGADAKGGGPCSSKGTGKDSWQDLYKTELCQFFDRGCCTKGVRCQFAHGAVELRPKAGQNGAGGGKTCPKVPSPVQKEGAQGPGRYKTELCMFFERGMCMKGTGCSFAHGSEELQRGPAAQEAKAAQAGAAAAVGGDAANGAAPPERRGGRASPASSHATALAWLESMRGKGGHGGAEFEATWKAWCRDHDLSNLPKPQRLESIAAFKEAWEAGNLGGGVSSSSSAVSMNKATACGDVKGEMLGNDTSNPSPARSDANVLEWLQEMRGRESQIGAKFEAAWKSWCQEKDFHILPKPQQLDSIAAFREVWEAGSLRCDMSNVATVVPKKTRPSATSAAQTVISEPKSTSGAEFAAAVATRPSGVETCSCGHELTPEARFCMICGKQRVARATCEGSVDSVHLEDEATHEGGEGPGVTHRRL